MLFLNHNCCPRNTSSRPNWSTESTAFSNNRSYSSNNNNKSCSCLNTSLNK